jgi:hypothetical protein
MISRIPLMANPHRKNNGESPPISPLLVNPHTKNDYIPDDINPYQFMVNPPTKISQTYID